MGGNTAAEGHECPSGAAAATAPQASAPGPLFMQPVQSVFDNYIKVRGALARDSVEGVASAGTAMVKAVQADSMKMLPPKVAQQSEALAKAKDLEAARDAFKSLSESLISYVSDQKVAAGTYHVVYCPMAKASWLQTESTVINPYMGKAMIHCGQIKT
jgi:Cu(I)/Ag(I) efflux system membrane fusion protein